MGMNMSEKILARHAGFDSVEAGQLITCKLDMVLANDITAPPAIKEFEKIGGNVFDPAKIALVPGDVFGPGGEGYLRMSFANSYENIVEGCKRLSEAVAALRK